MLCNNCIHKNVCKHVENFKEYEKQYEEMRKQSSLFDKPIECPCYKKDVFTKTEIYNIEMVEDYLRVYLDNCSRNQDVMDSLQEVAFKCMIDILESHINKLKIN